MLEVHRQQATSRGLDITLVRGDAEDPPPGLGPFDVVVSRHLLWTLLRPQHGRARLDGAGRTGGRVIAIDILGLLAPTARAKIRSACGQAIQNLSESADPPTTILWRALRTLVQSGDPHYPDELTGRLPLQAARNLDPVRNIWQRAGLEQVLAEELTWLDNLEQSEMPTASRLQHHERRYLIEGRRQPPCSHAC